VLISSTETAKLADFGLSKKLEEVKRIAGDYTPDVGNVYWRAPEVMNTEECGFPVDIWSLGITMLEMIYDEPPFMRQEPYKYMWGLAKEKKIPEIPEFVNIGIQEILKRCLVYDPKERILASEILERISDIRM
jgi:serine/threonine protein kinase